MTDMDLDHLLHESGVRWRQAQGPSPQLDVAGLVTDQLRARGTRWSPAIAAAGAVLVTVTAVAFIQQVGEPTGAPGASAGPVVPSAGIAPGLVSGTWYHSVSPTVARSRHRTLVGDWGLELDLDGSARLARADGTVHVSGRWSLATGTLALTMPFPGCEDAASDYRPARSTLHSGLLELVPADESCQARAVVLDGHWFSTPRPG